MASSGIPEDAFYRRHVEKNWGGKMAMASRATSQEALEEELGFQVEEVIRAGDKQVRERNTSTPCTRAACARARAALEPLPTSIRSCVRNAALAPPSRESSASLFFGPC